jgi:AcrR family transcriptional regulator
MTAHVQPGVFFQPPTALPRGPHQLPREEVKRAQRERLMMAFTELLADRGYAGVRIVDIAKRAGVSNDAFYDIFTNKEACACAAYDCFIEVIGERSYGAAPLTGTTWREFVEANVTGYYGALAADPVVARAFQLEMDAVGAMGRARRRASAQKFAELWFEMQGQLRASDPLLQQRPLEVHMATLYGVRQIACDRLEEGDRHPSLEDLVPGIVDWIVAGWYEEPTIKSPKRETSRERVSSGPARR